MAKQLSPADLMAMIRAMGAESIEELAALATDSTRADAAEKIETRLIDASQTVERTVTDEDGAESIETVSLAESWTDHFFDLAESFAGDFSTEEIAKAGRGSGKILRTKVEISTPRGTFFVRLDRDA